MVVLDGGGSRDTGQEVLKESLHTQNGTFVVTGDLKGGQVKKMVNLWRRAQQQRTKIIGNLESAKKAKKATKKELPTVHSSAFLGKFLNGLEAGATGAFPSQTVKKEAALIPEHSLWGKAEPVRPAEVIETAKVANAHNFINSSPDGYHAQIGERGVQLSSGQKQGVAIALERCSRIDPAILLDETTPALDTELEKIVQEALDRLIKGRITIVIARRLLTIQQHTPSIAAVQERTRLVHLQNRL